MSTVASQILEFATRHPEGTVFGANELLSLGERAAIDQALVRLVAAGELARVARGAYAKTIRSRFGTRAPDSASLVRGFACRNALRVARHGAAEANRLGLSTQVPVQEVWWTSGRSTVLHAGALKIALKHAPDWLLVDPDGVAGAAVRAGDWLGPADAPQLLVKLRGLLGESERETVLRSQGKMPSWLARATREAFADVQ